MMLSEEEVQQCIKSVVKPIDEVIPKSPDMYPFQCDQSLLKTIIKISIKNPELKKRADIKYILNQVKAKKKIREGNTYLQQVVDSLKTYT